MDDILDNIDFSFKYILIAFNFMTIIVLYIHKRQQKINKQHHILLVTAHPDDQSMFFRPTIRNLHEEYFIHILVMTCKGTQRQKQMEEVGKLLKVHKICFVDDQNIKDGMKQQWDINKVQQHILDYIKANNIKAIFTFDSYGVSGHINHKSISTALHSLQKQPPKPQNSSTALPSNYIKVYYLQSVIMPRKLSGILQFPIALLKTYSWMSLNWIDGYKLMAAHKSQFVWYRKIWVFLSRYTYINTYTRKIIALQQKQKRKQE